MFVNAVFISQPPIILESHIHHETSQMALRAGDCLEHGRTPNQLDTPRPVIRFTLMYPITNHHFGDFAAII